MREGFGKLNGLQAEQKSRILHFVEKASIKTGYTNRNAVHKTAEVKLLFLQEVVKLLQLEHYSQCWASSSRKNSKGQLEGVQMKRILTRGLRIYPLEERQGEAELFSLKIKAPEGRYDNNLQIEEEKAC